MKVYKKMVMGITSPYVRTIAIEYPPQSGWGWVRDDGLWRRARLDHFPEGLGSLLQWVPSEDMDDDGTFELVEPPCEINILRGHVGRGDEVWAMTRALDLRSSTEFQSSILVMQEISHERGWPHLEEAPGDPVEVIRMPATEWWVIRGKIAVEPYQGLIARRGDVFQGNIKSTQDKWNKWKAAKEIPQCVLDMAGGQVGG